MPTLTQMLSKLHRPPMSLKQFMLRTEVLKLYRGFMRLGRMIEKPPEVPTSTEESSCGNTKNLHPLQLEWIDWVRAEFRLRQGTNDEEAIRMMLAHGKRQLQEMERTIMIATNRNSNRSVSSALGTTVASNVVGKPACKHNNSIKSTVD